VTAAIVPPDSEYITALIAAGEFRRTMVRDGHLAANAADALLENREQLAALVNTLFWTSLGVEEGRPVRGAVCICSPDQAHRPMVFEQSEPITLKSLTGLLTASPNAPLGVHLDGISPRVWGFVDSRPFQAITLRIGGPGTIVAICDQNTVALLHEGSVHVTDSIGALSLGQLLVKALGIEAAFPEKLKRASAFEKAITAMHARQHGGAIVIGPTSNGEWQRAIDFRFRFTSSSSGMLSQSLGELETVGADGDNTVAELTHERLLASRAQRDAHIALFYKKLQQIGKLTGVDGALVLRDDLTVLGFGAKLNCAPAEFSVSRVDAITRLAKHDRPLAEVGGTRHQSAARFVNQHRDCNVVVSSQDGRLTLVSWLQTPASVVAISGLEHFVWAELP
jgi:hypothetical protein